MQEIKHFTINFLAGINLRKFLALRTNCDRLDSRAPMVFTVWSTCQNSALDVQAFFKSTNEQLNSGAIEAKSSQILFTIYILT